MLIDLGRFMFISLAFRQQHLNRASRVYSRLSVWFLIFFLSAQKATCS